MNHLIQEIMEMQPFLTRMEIIEKIHFFVAIKLNARLLLL
jgi:hypothetical protein